MPAVRIVTHDPAPLVACYDTLLDTSTPHPGPHTKIPTETGRHVSFSRRDASEEVLPPTVLDPAVRRGIPPTSRPDDVGSSMWSLPRVLPMAATEPVRRRDALDEAYDPLARAASETHAGFVNHGPAAPGMPGAARQIPSLGNQGEPSAGTRNRHVERSGGEGVDLRVGLLEADVADVLPGGELPGQLEHPRREVHAQHRFRPDGPAASRTAWPVPQPMSSTCSPALRRAPVPGRSNQANRLPDRSQPHASRLAGNGNGPPAPGRRIRPPSPDLSGRRLAVRLRAELRKGLPPATNTW